MAFRVEVSVVYNFDIDIDAPSRDEALTQAVEFAQSAHTIYDPVYEAEIIEPVAV